MSLPESIQRNADQADELEKQIIGSAEAPGDEAPQAGEDTATAEEQTHTYGGKRLPEIDQQRHVLVDGTLLAQQHKQIER